MSTDDANVTFSTDQSTPAVPGRRNYSLVFISDLRAGDTLSQLTPVDKTDFADLLGRARPTLPIAIKDPLGSGPDWEFQLTFDSPPAFEPDGLLGQVSGARWRTGVRAKILERQRGRISASKLDEALSAAAGADASLVWLQRVGAAPSAPPTAAAETAPMPEGAGILDMVDEPDEGARVAADVERLAARAGDRDARISATESGRLSQLLQRLDAELAGIVAAVLKHPELRRIETAWRGLKFVVDRVDFRADVRLAVLHAPRDEAVSRFVEQVVNPAFDGEIPTPGLVVFDYAFTNTPSEIAMLDELGQHAASLPVPVVFPLDARFFNVKNLGLLKNLPNLSGLVDGWQFAKYKSLRDQPYAKSLAPVLGRFPLRAPYAPRKDAGEFTFAETVSGERDLLWGGGHLAMAVCAARSYAKHGWPTRMFGAAAGKIEDLPVVENPKDPQKPWGPGDLFLPDRRLGELPAVGINLLQAVKGKDYCILLGGVSAARPVKTAEHDDNQALLEVSLPYQQFANIAGAYLCEQMPKLHGLPAEQIQQHLLFGLRDLMKLTDEDGEDAAMVGVGAAPDDASRTLVHVRMTPPGRIVPGGLHIDFNFRVSA